MESFRSKNFHTLEQVHKEVKLVLVVELFTSCADKKWM